MLRFLGEVLIPFGYLDTEVARSVGNALAPQARLYLQPGGIVELIQFGVRRFVASFEALAHDNMARGAGADTAAGVVEPHVKSGGDIQNASGKALSCVRNFLGVHLDRFALADKGDLEFLCRGRVFDLFDVRIAAAHCCLLLNSSMLRACSFALAWHRLQSVRFCVRSTRKPKAHRLPFAQLRIKSLCY